MRKLAPALLTIAMLTGCGDSRNPTAPDAFHPGAPAATLTSSSTSFTVLGFTTGPRGQFYQPASYWHCASSTYVEPNYSRQTTAGDSASPWIVTVGRHCALDAGGQEAQNYNGGWINVFSVAPDGSELFIGQVPGNLTRTTYDDFPSMSSVRLEAHGDAMQGCQFAQWDSGAAGPVLVIPAGSVSGDLPAAYFDCRT
jgi:hypothetical protein